VNFSAVSFTVIVTLNPCNTTQEMYVCVHYYDVKGNLKEGEPISAELRKRCAI
jgi:hypothetical protein